MDLCSGYAVVFAVAAIMFPHIPCPLAVSCIYPITSFPFTHHHYPSFLITPFSYGILAYVRHLLLELIVMVLNEYIHLFCSSLSGPRLMTHVFPPDGA